MRGTQRLMGITKRGNTYLRTLRIHGARTPYCAMQRRALGAGLRGSFTGVAARPGPLNEG